MTRQNTSLAKSSRTNINRDDRDHQQTAKEPGRGNPRTGRTARDSTSINPADRDPIDPRMPHLPPA